MVWKPGFFWELKLFLSFAHSFDLICNAPKDALISIWHRSFDQWNVDLIWGQEAVLVSKKDHFGICYLLNGGSLNIQKGNHFWMPVATPFITFRAALIFDLCKFHGQDLLKTHNENAIYDHPKITYNAFNSWKESYHIVLLFEYTSFYWGIFDLLEIVS